MRVLLRTPQRRNEQNVEPGFRLWADQAQNIRALPTTNDALKNIVVTGEAQIAPWFGGIWKFWADEGAPLGFVNPKEGAIAFPFTSRSSRAARRNRSAWPRTS